MILTQQCEGRIITRRAQLVHLRSGVVPVLVADVCIRPYKSGYRGYNGDRRFVNTKLINAMTHIPHSHLVYFDKKRIGQRPFEPDGMVFKLAYSPIPSLSYLFNVFISHI